MSSKSTISFKPPNQRERNNKPVEMNLSNARDCIQALKHMANPTKALFLPKFFKSGPGEYADGDQFMGVTVPNIRLVARNASSISIKEIDRLLHSRWHEARMLALFVLVNQYKKATSDAAKRKIYTFYLTHTAAVNNWDLVDCSCREIIGAYLYEHPEQAGMLDVLANSSHLWNRRIAMVSTYYFLQKGEAAPTIRLAEKLMGDKHDLIQKAAGWMLREMGKKVDRVLLVSFLNRHAHEMPRTMLRYAIEHFDRPSRLRFMAQTR